MGRLAALRRAPTKYAPSAASKTIAAVNKSSNEKRNADRDAWIEWYNKPWNKIRAWSASLIFGTKGWKLFHQSYYQTAIDIKVRQIEHSIPDTWTKAIHHMPEWIQLITEEEHKSNL